VDQILDKRLVTEYLVSYGSQETTKWVKQSQIPNAKEAIKTFNQRLLNGEITIAQEGSSKAINKRGRPRKSLVKD
jgi:hypothetical protein